jgi:hypothetical protein
VPREARQEWAARFARDVAPRFSSGFAGGKVATPVVTP